MTALAPTVPVTPEPGVHRHVVTVSRKLAITLGVVTALSALLYLLAPREGDTSFRLATGTEAVDIGDLQVPGMATAWVCVAVMALLTAYSVVRTWTNRRTGIWVAILFAFAFLVAFLSWAGAGSDSDIPVSRLIAGSVLLSVPIVFGALGGVIGERAGVVNIAIEGQLLAGAFTAAFVGTLTGSPWAGLIAAVLSGVLVALVLGVFAIKYRVNQVIVGVVLNVLVIGLTSFLYSTVMVPDAEKFNQTERFGSLAIPLLSKIPILGPALFNQPIVVYMMYVAVPAVWFALMRTRWGLRVRAVGEHPTAADTVGIKVERTRYRALLVAGAITGIGGGFYTVVSVSSFGKEMTAGAGFIALAAVIFGKWDPVRAALAALLFGFASNLEGTLSIVGAPVPSQFMLMLPYVVTILAVAGLVGRSRPPAASGEPYVKG